MADVKWIKIVTDIFDDEKMALIDAMPDRDGVIVIWFKLLCLAGKHNNGGVFMLNDKIAYTDEMLATIFRRPVGTVRLALTTFEQFGMVEIVNNVYTIPNWEKHQSLDKLEATKEQTRQRVAKYRAKQAALAQPEQQCNVTVTLRNADRIRIDKEEEKEIDIHPPLTPQGTADGSTDKQTALKNRFGEFWKAYPRKVGKTYAEKAWNKIKPTAELHEKILQAVELQKKQPQWLKDDGQYIPHPSTWLNGGYWENETEVQADAARSAADDEWFKKFAE